LLQIEDSPLQPIQDNPDSGGLSGQLLLLLNETVYQSFVWATVEPCCPTSPCPRNPKSTQQGIRHDSIGAIAIPGHAEAFS
jgi:hypothetical protein